MEMPEKYTVFSMFKSVQKLKRSQTLFKKA